MVARDDGTAAPPDAEIVDVEITQHEEARSLMDLQLAAIDHRAVEDKKKGKHLWK